MFEGILGLPSLLWKVIIFFAVMHVAKMIWPDESNKLLIIAVIAGVLIYLYI